MTDPTTDDSAAKQEDQFNFNWWVTMLPFMGIICYCIYQYAQDRSNMGPLWWAAAALVVGLGLGSVVANASGTADGGEQPKGN